MTYRWGLVAAWLLGHKNDAHVVITFSSTEKKNKLIWIVFLTMLWEMSNLYLPKQLNSELLTSPNPHLSNFNSTYMVIRLWLTKTFALPEGAVSWNAAFGRETVLRIPEARVSSVVHLNWKEPHWLHKISSDFKEGHGHGPAGKALKSLGFCCPQENKGHVAQQLLLAEHAPALFHSSSCSSSKPSFPRDFSANSSASWIHLMPHLPLPTIWVLDP